MKNRFTFRATPASRSTSLRRNVISSRRSLRIEDPGSFAAATGVRGVPFAFAVDRVGGIKLHVLGLPDDQEVAALVAALRSTSILEPTRMVVRDYMPMAAVIATAGAK